DRRTLRIGELFGGQRMPGAEHVKAGIDQVQRLHYPGHLLKWEESSGRLRSATTLLAWPMWMKPAIDSSSAMPKRALTAASRAAQPVSHCAPNPNACAACNSAKQTQPVVISCSISGTLGFGCGQAMT